MKNEQGQYICCLTGSIVPQERAEFLLSSGVEEDELTVIGASEIGRKYTRTASAFEVTEETSKLRDRALRHATTD